MAEKLVKRSDKKMFWGIPATGGSGTATFTRMKGFTELSGSKNPTEYERQYVDEDFARTDVTGYSPSWSFAFDEFVGDAVCEDIVGILDGEKLGTDAQRDIIQVDFTKTKGSGGFEAIKRTVSVIGDTEGDSTDAYTYSGTFRTSGSPITGTATISTPAGGNSKDVLTITFEEDTEDSDQ